MYKAEEILDVSMEIGVNLLQCGAEIRRVEETITYICKAYGASEVDVFAIPSLILATIVVDGESYTTKIKRNLDVTTDLFRLEKYNKLSRKICKDKPSLKEVKEEVKKIKEIKDYNTIYYILQAELSTFINILLKQVLFLFFNRTKLIIIPLSHLYPNQKKRKINTLILLFIYPIYHTSFFL